MAQPKRKKYLNNSDLLREIHNSKIAYCYLLDREFSMYDYIVFDVADITESLIEKALVVRQTRYNNKMVDEIRESRGLSLKKAKEYIEAHKIPYPEIQIDEVVIRVITDEHIPFVNDDDTQKKVPTNFEAFKQYIIDPSGELVEVVRSHWVGDLETGSFSTTHGSLTNELGKMFIKLAEHYSHKPNFRNYTYLDEMMGEARIQLVKNALKFNESIFYRAENPVTQLNPFAYYTSCVNNAFKSVLNTEKVVRNLRDVLLSENGMEPSFTRQVEIEIEMLDEKLNANNTL